MLVQTLLPFAARCLAKKSPAAMRQAAGLTLLLLGPLLLAGCMQAARPGLVAAPAATLPAPDLPPVRAEAIVPVVGLGKPVAQPDPLQALVPQPPGTKLPGGVQPTLKPPPLEAGDVPLPINFAAALRLADARPLTVAAAQASAWVAEAQLQRAKVIWVPEMDIDIVYYRHDGFGPDFNRGGNPTPFDINSQRLPINQNLNYFYGGGGLYWVFMLTDAIFQPLAARQVLDSKRWDIQTAKNDAVLDTARAYFDVHKYRGMYAASLDVLRRGRESVERISLLTEELVPSAEANRIRRLLADLQIHVASTRERWRVASADLTQILRLDPRAIVVPTEHDHLQITLIDPARPLEDLMPLALRARPELAAQQALIQAAQVRIRQEKLRPFLPKIMIQGFQTPGDMRMQFGIFGTGAGNSMNLWSWRNDITTQIAWQAEGLGFGNLARVKEQRGEESRAIVDLNHIQDMVAAEVTQAQAHLQSATLRVTQAERALREALENYNKNYEGLAQTKRIEGKILEQAYRPQEVVAALTRLGGAYDNYFMTVADYNEAQFALFHALGYPAQDISRLWPPGEAMPVDTSRPGYLPAVGIGPPPATR